MRPLKSIMTPAIFAALGVAALSAPAHAASSEESRYTHPACEGTNAVCGVIVMINGNSAVLDWVSLNARNSQPYPAQEHPKCLSVDKKFDRNTPSANYDVFVVPASCAYKLKTKILAGDKKDINLYLTPGCRIKAQVSGSASQSKWKTLEIDALSDQVPTDKNGKPIDGGPYKCGKQSGADNPTLS